MPILFERKADCCGCGACKQACPVSAITMVADEHGFLYPFVNNDLCVECKKCERACHYKNEPVTKICHTALAAVTKSTDIMKSTSGGVFACIATEFIEQGGVVFGSVLRYKENKVECTHDMAQSLEELEKMLGSKYVQSNTSEIFKEVKAVLDEGRNVLFSGTPCQSAALKCYLEKDYANLYTLDLICHGVPNEQLFNDYLSQHISKGSCVTEFLFRDKRKGTAYTSKLVTENGNSQSAKYFHQGTSSYLYNFINSNISRESCYECRFADKKRVSDVTIGDFWGVKKNQPDIPDKDFDVEKGISCVLINTQQGQRLMDEYSQGLLKKDSSIDIIAMENEQLCKPSTLSEERRIILDLYEKQGYEAVEKHFRSTVGADYYKSVIKSKIPTGLKNKIKSII